MNPDMQKRPDYGFLAGLFTGTCVGAGLAMWCAPQSATELRGRVTETGRRLGQRASEQYQHATE